jgi:hypothetical protein
MKKIGRERERESEGGGGRRKNRKWDSNVNLLSLNLHAIHHHAERRSTATVTSLLSNGLALDRDSLTLVAVACATVRAFTPEVVDQKTGARMWRKAESRRNIFGRRGRSLSHHFRFDSFQCCRKSRQDSLPVANLFFVLSGVADLICVWLTACRSISRQRDRERENVSFTQLIPKSCLFSQEFKLCMANWFEFIKPTTLTWARSKCCRNRTNSKRIEMQKFNCNQKGRNEQRQKVVKKDKEVNCEADKRRGREWYVWDHKRAMWSAFYHNPDVASDLAKESGRKGTGRLLHVRHVIRVQRNELRSGLTKTRASLTLFWQKPNRSKSSEKRWDEQSSGRMMLWLVVEWKAKSARNELFILEWSAMGMCAHEIEGNKADRSFRAPEVPHTSIALSLSLSLSLTLLDPLDFEHSVVEQEKVDV